MTVRLPFPQREKTLERAWSYVVATIALSLLFREQSEGGRTLVITFYLPTPHQQTNRQTLLCCTRHVARMGSKLTRTRTESRKYIRTKLEIKSRNYNYLPRPTDLPAALTLKRAQNAGGIGEALSTTTLRYSSMASPHSRTQTHRSEACPFREKKTQCIHPQPKKKHHVSNGQLKKPTNFPPPRPAPPTHPGPSRPVPSPRLHGQVKTREASRSKKGSRAYFSESRNNFPSKARALRHYIASPVSV